MFGGKLLRTRRPLVCGEKLLCTKDSFALQQFCLLTYASPVQGEVDFAQQNSEGLSVHIVGLMIQ